MPSFSTLVSTILAISASALAFTTPTAYNQTSNPVYTPNTGAIIPVGAPYKITWGPTESGTVSIILLRGPSKNIKPLYPIVEKIANTGSYTWTPKKTLEDDTTEYGIQIIIDSNGQFQYSTQFGISNPDYVAPSSTTTSSGGYATEEPTTTSYATVDVTSKTYSTSLITVTTAPIKNNTTSVYVPTYVPPTNNYTATYTPPSASDEPTPSETETIPVPSQTGAAASIKVASGLLVGVAGVIAMIL